MRNWIVAALLASAAMAVPAFAQDHGDEHVNHGDGKHQGEGDHRGGGQPGQPGQQGGGQPQHAQQAPQQVQQAPQQGRGGNDLARRPQFQQRGGQPGGNPDNDMRERPGLRGQPSVGVYGGTQPARQADQRARGGDGFDRGNPQGDGRHYQARGDNGVNVWQGQGRAGGDPRLAGHDDRRDGRQNGRGDDRRGDGRPGWNGEHGGQDVGRDRGGDWNRGWRQDRRYDWQGWRAGHREIYRAGRYRAPYGFGGGYRRFGLGYRLPSIFFAEQYWIDNPDYYRLPPAYGEYRWVRYYNDALLIDLDNGEVVDVIPSFFY